MFSYEFSIWQSSHTDRPESPVLTEIKSRDGSKDKLNAVSLPHASAQVEKKTQPKTLQSSQYPRGSLRRQRSLAHRASLTQCISTVQCSNISRDIAPQESSFPVSEPKPAPRRTGACFLDHISQPWWIWEYVAKRQLPVSVPLASRCAVSPCLLQTQALCADRDKDVSCSDRPFSYRHVPVRRRTEVTRPTVWSLHGELSLVTTYRHQLEGYEMVTQKPWWQYQLWPAQSCSFEE